jgi:RNA:NAD 2'-phosphotransferase (TPT1/KptA family)
MDLTRVSKLLSLVLRHKPEEIGLTLDPQGWAEVDQLIHLINARGTKLTLPLLEQVVATNDKQRFMKMSEKTTSLVLVDDSDSLITRVTPYPSEFQCIA